MGGHERDYERHIVDAEVSTSQDSRELEQHLSLLATSHRKPYAHLVEDVEVAFATLVAYDAHLLEQVNLYRATDNASLSIMAVTWSIVQHHQLPEA